MPRKSGGGGQEDNGPAKRGSDSQKSKNEPEAPEQKSKPKKSFDQDTAPQVQPPGNNVQKNPGFEAEANQSSASGGSAGSSSSNPKRRSNSNRRSQDKASSAPAPVPNPVPVPSSIPIPAPSPVPIPENNPALLPATDQPQQTNVNPTATSLAPMTRSEKRESVRMLVPKPSRVIETIVLDHTPSLDLELEVDRLVAIAQTQCEREKNDIKRRYENELRTLRGKLEAENSKMRVEYDEQIRLVKLQAAEETRASTERDIVGPLKDMISRYENEIQSLRSHLADDETSDSEKKRLIDGLQTQINDLKGDLRRAGEFENENNKLKEEVAKLRLIEQESQHLKQRYNEGQAENEELKKKLDKLLEVEKDNSALQQTLDSLKTVQEENERLKKNLDRGSEEIKKLEDQISRGEQASAKTNKKFDGVDSCAEENKKIQELSIKLITYEEQNRLLLEELDRYRNSSSSASVQTMPPASVPLSIPVPQPSLIQTQSTQIQNSISSPVPTFVQNSMPASPVQTFVQNAMPASPVPTFVQNSMPASPAQTFVQNSMSANPLPTSVPSPGPSVPRPMVSLGLPPPPDRDCSKCSRINVRSEHSGLSIISSVHEERDVLREKVRMLERRVEELVQHVDSLNQGGNRGPMTPQRTNMAPLTPTAPPLAPRPQPMNNVNAVLDRLSSLEQTLGAFSQRYDSQMGQLQSNMRQQDTSYRSVLGGFSTEISAIKTLIRSEAGGAVTYNDDEGCCPDEF